MVDTRCAVRPISYRETGPLSDSSEWVCVETVHDFIRCFVLARGIWEVKRALGIRDDGMMRQRVPKTRF